MKKQDYAVIESDDKVKFEKEVIRVINMGYTLVGGVTITETTDQPILYFQAMTKEYEVEEE